MTALDAFSSVFNGERLLGRPLTNDVVFNRVGRLCSKDGPAVREDQGDLNNKSLCPGILIPRLIECRKWSHEGKRQYDE
ncbi:hypothetical protein Y696_10875 [Mesotoga sp. H07pep.5.4]|uniref:hypothetical protein n=1 Tax=Mesotoga sp. H07pep.5.4 TaxID=1463664 RepID=UPI000EF1635C|nr:hypothetical protein [Mesotoga sp. H07pep.5.4]RLL81408.1 hypothetical protein Y696_10875 [Mesotoga sp. H07pep.5.4]